MFILTTPERRVGLNATSLNHEKFLKRPDETLPRITHAPLHNFALPALGQGTRYVRVFGWLLLAHIWYLWYRPSTDCVFLFAKYRFADTHM